MKFYTADIAIIGAGPAGLSAALAARRAGANVHLLDAGANPGGQYWLQEFFAPSGPQSREGAKMIEAVRAAGVTIHQNTEIWGIFPGANGHEIAATQDKAGLKMRAQALILATGAHDRVIPFPGWTLPGVMTPGGAQRLIKSGGTLAGRIALAGSGPFLAAVLQTLSRHDSAPAAFIEARPFWNRALLRHLALHPQRWAETARLAKNLAGSKKHFGWIVTEARGRDRLESVRLARIRPDGTLDASRTKEIGALDFLLVGYGFRPNIELAALLGCRLAFDDAAGGWHVAADATGRTSVERVFAAGEITGLAGARPARFAGFLSGLAAAETLGFSHPATAARRVARLAQNARARAFAAGLNAAYAPLPALDALMTDETVICRCEDITAATIRQAVQEGAGSVGGVKIWTRAGMGPCQGRSCGWALARLVAASAGVSLADAGFNPPHIPVRPVALSVAAETLAERAKISAAASARNPSPGPPPGA